MTRSLAVDGSNDIFIDATGALAIATGVQAVLFVCQQAAQAQRGEMLYAVDEGMPTKATAWSGVPNLRQFEAALRATLRAVPDVTGIKSVTVSASGGVLSYTVEIQTIYGTGVING